MSDKSDENELDIRRKCELIQKFWLLNKGDMDFCGLVNKTLDFDGEVHKLNFTDDRFFSDIEFEI